MKLEEATPAQRAAITTEHPLVLVLAGPGSGKTATTVARINYLIEGGALASQFAVLTFTNSGAREIEGRIQAIETVAKNETQLGHVGTLHSFALRMLKEHGGPFGYGERTAVISPESALDLLQSKARTLGCKTPIKDLLALKAKGRPARTARLDVPGTVVASYYDDMKEAGIVDYDLILWEFRAILACVCSDPAAAGEVQAKIAAQFPFLFVDEVQDSAPIDWDIYDFFPARMKFLVGDTDQSIFSFRGGAVRRAIGFASRADVEVIRLEENFRSRVEICDAAQRLIEHNGARVAKRTVSTSGPGGEVFDLETFDTEGSEIGAVSHLVKAMLAVEPGIDVAVLARTNAVANNFRATMRACALPVVERTVSALPRDWPLARAFVELLVNPENDSLAFFYLVALYEKKGANPAEAREAAHAARKAAASVGKSINRANLGFGKILRPSSAMEAMAGSVVSRESRMIALDRFRQLPDGASMLDLALALGEVREHVTEAEGTGVHVLTIHGSKGREFDVVFVVGCEDESLPARFPDTDVEEERRLAYVAITRARRRVYFSHARSRANPWGGVSARTTSRFIAEALPFTLAAK